MMRPYGAVRCLALIGMVAVFAAGCARPTDQQKPMAVGGRGDAVATVAFPADPAADPLLPVPRAGERLGRGALAVVRATGPSPSSPSTEFHLEVLSPDGRPVARGRLPASSAGDQTAVHFGRNPWLPGGRGLVYGSRSRGSLRVIDFVKGEDRRLLSVAPDRAPGNLLVWRVLGDRVYFHMETWSRRGKGGPTALWRIGLDGANLEQMEFTGPGPEDHEYLKDVRATDVSPDGRYLLLAGIGVGMRPSAAVFRVDLSSTQGSATRISPEDEESVADGSFTADGRGVMMQYPYRVRDRTDGRDQPRVGVILAGLDGSDPQRFGYDQPVRIPVARSPDGERLALAEFTGWFWRVTFRAISVTDPGGGAPVLLARSTSRTRFLRPVGFTADGKGFLIWREESGEPEKGAVLQRIDLVTGDTVTLARGVREVFLAE